MAAIVAFHDFELDELRFELRRAGRRVSVQPKVLRLLFYLTRHRQRCVSSQELLRELWPGEHVTLASIKRAIGGARRVLGEDAGSQATIRTVRGHGYQFVRKADERDSREPRVVRSTPCPHTFVGREHVLAQLEQQLAAARAGHGQLVLVSGEPGIGKTRLLQELATHVVGSGGHAWLGRCTHDEGAPALWPLAQMLRSAAAELGPEALLRAMGPGAADIVTALPELLRIYPQLAASPELESRAQRFRLFDSLLCCFERIASAGALCLMVDDLQYADAVTLALVTFFAQHVTGSHLLVLASLRPNAKLEPIEQGMLASLRQRSALCEIALSGLEPEAIARWMAARGGAPATPERAASLHQQTAGNPLFLERILHAGCEGDVGTQGLASAIEQHLGQLTVELRERLQMASVLGLEFTLTQLADMCAAEPRGLVPPLTAAVEVGLLRSVAADGGKYTFAHALIRDALYHQLAPDTRARLHGLAARTLESLVADGELRLSQLAEHYVRAAPDHDGGRAMRAAQQAARAALERTAFEEAARWFERARRGLELSAPDPSMQLELMLQQAQALARTADTKGARTLLLAVVAGAREQSAADMTVRAACALGELPETGSVDDARVEVIRFALGTLAPPDPRRVSLEALLAKALSYSRDRAGCTRVARSALSAAEELPDPRARAQAFIACWHALVEPECLDERDHIADSLARLGHEQRDYGALYWSAIARIGCAVERGDMASVDAGIDTIRALAEHGRDPISRWHELMFRAMRFTLAGDLAQARHCAEAAYHLGSALGDAGIRHVYCTQLSAIYRIQGKLAEAERLVREVSLSHPQIAGWQAVLATLEAEQGRKEHARKVLERLVERDLEVLRNDAFSLSVIAATADLCRVVGDATHARAIYRALRPYEERHGSVSIGIASNGPLARHLARLALQMHDYAAAERHVQRALALAEAMPSPLYTSACLLDYAHVLLVTRSHGVELPQTLIARAARLGREHQLPLVGRYAEALVSLARGGAIIAATQQR